jgi:hypothetical protein
LEFRYNCLSGGSTRCSGIFLLSSSIACSLWGPQVHDTFCFWLPETVPETFSFGSSIGDVDAIPETEGIGWSETVPETFRFGNSFCAPNIGNGFGSTYSIPDTLGFGNVIEAPETADFPAV